MFRRKLALGVVASILIVALAALLFACSQTPTSVPVRTFERAQKMDVACVQLYDRTTGQPIEPLGRPQDECATVPANVDGNTFDKQLYALVTQTTRGELAVVNLSAGFLIDQSRATPGINFLPVGAVPTDVATTPDGKMAFVASAEVNKAAIYGIPTRRILGDTDNRFPHDPNPATLGSWPVCVLPQIPAALTIVPRSGAPLPAPADAGAGDAGDAGDAGAAGTPDVPEYEIVVVLPGDRVNSAKIVTIDPRPFRRGGLPRKPDGTLDFTSDPTLTPGYTLEPGVPPAQCPFLSAIELVGSTAVPTSFAPGPKWDDGVKYVEGGVDLTCLLPAEPAHCGLPPCCGNTTVITPVGEAGTVEAGVPGSDAGACAPVTAQDAGPIPLDVGPLDPPKVVSIVRDGQIVYVADEGVPLIHVIDLTTPGAPRELPPLLATSVLDPARAVQVSDLALSPSTSEYKRFLYAVDRVEGSLMVYDVTDPATMQRTPLSRPHPELNPFQPPDRIAFSSPVVAVAFARHDVPLSIITNGATPNGATGVLCNPNPNLDSNPSLDLGFYYRPVSTDTSDITGNPGPRRLRGIYGFATLSNGQVFALDVDDWDSPCRRPINMAQPVSDIAPAEPAPSGPTDINPYHVPDAGPLAVTNEAFFPMTAPHSLRSEVLDLIDTTTGSNLPHLQGTPTVSVNGVVLPQSGAGSAGTPILVPPHFATEIPQVQIDQDWTATFEGALPGFDGISGLLSTTDGYQSLVLAQPQGHFCAKGVEDWAQGIERTNAIARELVQRGITPNPGADRLTTDYIQLTDDILAPDDPYWTVNQDCWDPSLAPGLPRQDQCVRTFGSASDQSTQRDFPIIQAYDDKLVLGRFFTTAAGAREVVYSDPSNASSLKLMKCCFHNQARFRVRTGNLWANIGVAPGGLPGSVGFFSHVTTDSAGRCVVSCDPRQALLNGRIPTAPSTIVPATIGRNSALAMRNPMFDTRIIGPTAGTAIARDATYSYSTRGQFRGLFVSIGGASTAVSPQSMRFIPSLGQIAVVDGASQGLVLIDLRQVTVARAPYF